MDNIITAEQLLFQILSETKHDDEVEYLRNNSEGKEMLESLVELINNRTKQYVSQALKIARKMEKLEHIIKLLGQMNKYPSILLILPQL